MNPMGEVLNCLIANSTLHLHSTCYVVHFVVNCDPTQRCYSKTYCFHNAHSPAVIPLGVLLQLFDAYFPRLRACHSMASVSKTTASLASSRMRPSKRNRLMDQSRNTRNSASMRWNFIIINQDFKFQPLGPKEFEYYQLLLGSKTFFWRVAARKS
jgi:hypothetical protein